MALILLNPILPCPSTITPLPSVTTITEKVAKKAISKITIDTESKALDFRAVVALYKEEVLPTRVNICWKVKIKIQRISSQPKPLIATMEASQ